MTKKSLAAPALLVAGFVLGLLVPNALYLYGGTESVPYRVNRLTGVQEYTSPWGWVSQEEIDRRVDEKIDPEIARFGERLAQMRLAADRGTLRKIDVTGRQVSAYYADGRKEEYYATDLEDPRLEDVQDLANRLASSEPTSTAGSTGPPMH